MNINTHFIEWSHVFLPLRFLFQTSLISV